MSAELVAAMREVIRARLELAISFIDVGQGDRAVAQIELVLAQLETP